MVVRMTSQIFHLPEIIRATIVTGLLAAGLSCVCQDPAFAGEQPKPANIQIAGAKGEKPQPGSVQLKNGLIISGLCCTVSTLDPLLPGMAIENRVEQGLHLRLIHQGAREVYVHVQQSARPVILNDVWPALTYPIPRKFSRRKALTLGRQFPDPGPFDVQGISRGLVQEQGKDIPLEVAISGINELYAEVTGITHQWEYRITLDSVSQPTMQGLLALISDYDTDAIRRLELIRMLVRADRLEDASTLLEATLHDFPEMADQQKEFRELIREQRAREAVSVAERKLNSGGHQQAGSQALRLSQSDYSPETQVRVQRIVRHYRDTASRIDRVTRVLYELASTVVDDGRSSGVRTVLRSVIPALNEDTIDRFSAFEGLFAAELEADNQPPQPDAAEELLAMGLSGWLLGPENAFRNLSDTLSLFESQQLILDYMNTTPDEVTVRRELAERISRSEGAGIERIAAIIRHLPPVRPAAVSFPSETSHGEFSIPATADSAGAVGTVPSEYRGTREYPLVIVFSPGNAAEVFDLCRFLSLWDGCITLVPGPAADPPDNLEPGEEPTESGATPTNSKKRLDTSAHSHRQLLSLIRRTKAALRIDDNRVFCAGVGAGGDLAMDFAAAHPELFAGIISLGGTGQRQLLFTAPNAVRIPWYLVVSDGQNQGRWFEQMRALTSKLFKREGDRYYDTVFVKYPGLGPLKPHQEFRHLSAWLAIHERDPWPAEISARVGRSSDLRWDWLRLQSLPEQYAQLDTVSDLQSKEIRPARLEAHCNDRNYIVVETAPADVTIMLSPELPGIDLAKPISIDAGRRKLQVDFEPRIPEMLEELYETGDRKRLCYMRIHVAK